MACYFRGALFLSDPPARISVPLVSFRLEPLSCRSLPTRAPGPPLFERPGRRRADGLRQITWAQPVQGLGAEPAKASALAGALQSLAGVAVSSRDGRALQVSLIGSIPLDKVGFGEYTQHDFSESGETFTMQYEDATRDISRFQVRLRDHAGNLIELPNPGLTLMLKVILG